MALAALITWNYALNDETGFLLQRSTNSGSTWDVNFPQPTTSSYVDDTVVLYGTYWYRIAATNRYGTGSWSNTGSVWVPPSIPGGPYDLVVVSGSAILTWISGSINEEYFAVQRSTGGGFSDFAVSLVETYTDNTVVSDYTPQFYNYQVAAVDISGTSSFSNTASITFIWPPPPPIDLLVTSGSAHLEWSFQGPEDLNQTGSIYKSLDGNVYSYYDHAVPNTPRYDDLDVTGSVTGATYWYKVRTETVYGTTSSFSDTASIAFQWPPLAPQNLTAASGSGITALNWTESVGADSYYFEKSHDGISWFVWGSVGPTSYNPDTHISSSYTGNSYWYRLLARNSAGDSPWSNTASITFQWPPSAPINLVATSGSSMTILNWDSGSNGSDIFSFERSWDGGATWISFGSVASPPAQDDTGVSASFEGNTYSYRCYAVNAAGNSPNSETASITFTYDPPSGSIELNVASGSALVSWTSSIANAQVWNLYRSLNYGGFGYIATVLSDTHSYRHEDVTASVEGNTYSYEVNAQNSYGFSDYSNTASITFTQGGGAPPSGSPDISGSIGDGPMGAPDISGSII